MYMYYLYYRTGYICNSVLGLYYSICTICTKVYVYVLFVLQDGDY